MVLNYSSFLAILVACIGLLGLASFVIVQRTKEIGIRRVLGAPSFTIISLLTKEFLLAVAIANVIAWPIAYELMRWWLQRFVYRVGISPGLFLIAGLGTFAIAYLTIGYQALRAARANPVDSLKYE
jgi:putative ABC transport system permease protein